MKKLALPSLLFVFAIGQVVAQAPVSPTVPQQKNGTGVQRDTQRATVRPEDAQLKSLSPGGPEAVRNPSDAQFPDSALDALVLDPGQLERVKAMDARYAERLSANGGLHPGDAQYSALWEERKEEIATILTPMQYEKWQRYNRAPLQAAADSTHHIAH